VVVHESADAGAKGPGLSVMHIKDRLIFLQIKDYVKSFRRPHNLICRPKVVDKPEGKRILVLSPHFDDDVIGCGGTLYKHILSGDEVTIIYFTDGREGDPDFSNKRMLEAIRKEEARSATAILGIDDLIFLDEPETRLKVNKRLLEMLAGVFDRLSPDLVYLPSFIENHIDHLELNRIFFRLVRQSNMEFNVCAYEAWSPILPNIVVDIGQVIAKKEQALNEYKSQIRQVDYVNATLGLNRYRSAMNLHGRSYAEAFFFTTSKKYIDLMTKLRLDKRIFIDI
jgi:LmbE family N-acetylglucosaminyl deacetylase